MLNTSRRCFNKNSLTWWYVLKTSWKCLEEVLKTPWKRFWKMSWRCLKTFLQDVLKASSKRLENVLKTYDQDEYIGLDQEDWGRLEDVFWRRMTKVNIFVLIKISWRRLKDVFWRRRLKTSPRRLHQDKCLLGINV